MEQRIAEPRKSRADEAFVLHFKNAAEAAKGPKLGKRHRVPVSYRPSGRGITARELAWREHRATGRRYK